MENVNENPVVEEAVHEELAVEAPVVEAPVAEEPVLEAPVAEEPVVEAPVVEEPVEIAQEVKALGPVGNGAIGSTTTNQKAKPSKKKEEKDSVEKVALHSSKNVSWQGVGKVYRGYNIVTKDNSEKWLTRPHIRLATPEEVAKEFGK